MDTRNIKLRVAYDGTAYRGWQKTTVGPSIEGILQTNIEQVLQEKIDLQAASRTDAGVHAEGQIVNFFTKNLVDLKRFQHSLNCMLPKDVVILDITEAPSSFHPTLDCLGKKYCYSLCNTSIQWPQYRTYSWHYPDELAIPLMQEAAHNLIGTHDFSSFCNTKKNETYVNFIRTLSKIEIISLPQKRLIIIIKGTNFLYRMVRNIVGTLVLVGSQKITPEEIKAILASRDRKRAGVTAPAHGLCLQTIYYN